MHPRSDSREVIAYGKHHDRKEDVDLDASEVQRVLELKLKVTVISVIQQRKYRNCYEVPEYMSNS
jgi:hypothetical protein